MMIMIGIDPHKATHTAVAIDSNEQVLDEFTLRSSRTHGCAHLFWPHLRRLCSSDLAPPG